MARSTVFTTINRSQAVRLPKPVALPAGVRQVEITKMGRSRRSARPISRGIYSSRNRGPRVSLCPNVNSRRPRSVNRSE